MSDFSENRMLDISKLISGECGEIPFKADFGDTVEENGITVHGFSFSGKALGEADGITLNGCISCVLESACARCLAEVRRDFSVPVDVPVVRNADDGAEEEAVTAENDRIDLFSAAYEKLVLNLPFRLLCREDCKGFCSKCGKDLNTGECGCSEKEVDPRLSGLSDFFK